MARTQATTSKWTIHGDGAHNDSSEVLRKITWSKMALTSSLAQCDERRNSKNMQRYSKKLKGWTKAKQVSAL